MIKRSITYVSFIVSFVFTSVTTAADTYSPYVGVSHPGNVYFGDTHLHTRLSMDAYNLGNLTLGPEEAYRFARGDELIAHNGQPVRLHKPLDFLVVADHAENMGVMLGFAEKDPLLVKTEKERRWGEELKLINEARKTDKEKARALYAKMKKEFFTAGAIGDEAFNRSVWQRVTAYADQYNQPGQFTALIGYEWSAKAAKAFGPHRVIIFKDNADKARQIVPFSALDSDDPADLWSFLDQYEKLTGGQVLAIAHNGNLTNGIMFSPLDYKGKALTKGYAKLRQRWEPLYEITQIKGDSETHPVLSPLDEFADYERITLADYVAAPESSSDRYRRYEYVRSALQLGLQHKAQLGVDPFKFGVIGSTDAHTSFAAIDERNYWGGKTLDEANAARLASTNSYGASTWLTNAAGYAAVWAEENTRESLFAAMKRRETYATTGPRMTVRFFGGWGYEANDAFKPDLAKIGYSGGVPMGGDLTSAPKGKAPNFLIRAVKDADGANLDRVQVIKGWRTADGKLHEKVYNVALSGGRKDKGSKTREVGSTVDVKDASYTNTIGEPELATVWRDPDFKADELAFYYVRVLEIPTPRWTAYDAKYYGLTDIPEDVPMVHQERAYSSPIWYTP